MTSRKFASTQYATPKSKKRKSKTPAKLVFMWEFIVEIFKYLNLT